MSSRRLAITRHLRLALALVLVLTTSVAAGTFVSYNGGFHFSYPDTWEQVDYQTADYYIKQATGATDYEAVFATKDSPAVFEGVYVILTLDTTGQMSPVQIDSAVGVIRESFERNLVEMPLDSFAAGLTESMVAYDTSAQILAVLSNVTEEGGTPRKNLLAQKFYENGTANFYLYSPDSVLAGSLDAFTQMLSSFSTGEIEDDTTPLKVVDLESRRSSETDPTFILFCGLAVILIGLILVRVRQRKKN
jgi:hypothetical protein